MYGRNKMGISILFWILAIVISWIEPFLNRVLPDVNDY